MNTVTKKIILAGIVRLGCIDKGCTLILGPNTSSEFKKVTVKSIHCKRVDVKKGFQGQYCTIEVDVKENEVRKGMVLINPDSEPVATRLFEANIWNISDKDIKLVGEKTQLAISSGHIRQKATVKVINNTEEKDEIIIEPGETKTLQVEFCFMPEYLIEGNHLLILENSFKCYGVVTKLLKSNGS